MLLKVSLDSLPVNVESMHGAFMALKGSEVMSPMQCRAARAALKLTLQELADLAQVSRITVLRFETEQKASIAATVLQIKGALEKAGAEFPDLHTVRFPPKE
jgi:hypothetical protein